MRRITARELRDDDIFFFSRREREAWHRTHRPNRCRRCDAREAAAPAFQPDNPATALGLAVSHLMTKPAFANLRFGDWSRILVGQINRGHYRLVIDGNNEMQGLHWVGADLDPKRGSRAGAA